MLIYKILEVKNPQGLCLTLPRLTHTLALHSLKLQANSRAEAIRNSHNLIGNDRKQLFKVVQRTDYVYDFRVKMRENRKNTHFVIRKCNDKRQHFLILCVKNSSSFHILTLAFLHISFYLTLINLKYEPNFSHLRKTKQETSLLNIISHCS